MKNPTGPHPTLELCRTGGYLLHGGQASSLGLHETQNRARALPDWHNIIDAVPLCWGPAVSPELLSHGIPLAAELLARIVPHVRAFVAAFPPDEGGTTWGGMAMNRSAQIRLDSRSGLSWFLKTVLHEAWHVAEHDLSRRELRAVDRAVERGVAMPDGYWTSQVERRARAFEVWAMSALETGRPVVSPRHPWTRVFALVFSGRCARRAARRDRLRVAAMAWGVEGTDWLYRFLPMSHAWIVSGVEDLLLEHHRGLDRALDWHSRTDARLQTCPSTDVPVSLSEHVRALDQLAWRFRARDRVESDVFGRILQVPENRIASKAA